MIRNAWRFYYALSHVFRVQYCSLGVV
ncbi:DUF3265 domain-containing protein, partial [Vibrio parahaemolyticus]|nr:DUF3265 domain-containing protein [Vibrio parahaemolyticus]MCR9797464.1 DUF3265 domain-containing protein [Vibrio parahaemolyticus]HBH7909618.1 DUF3265 domain-containing protein [Vibrio parahaemolyticus]HCG9116230.1 DUF3265 domain-containing protein [Vibrio parahaemolyticus]